MNQEAVCSYPATSGKKAKEMSVYAWCVHCCLFVVVVVVVVCFQFFFFFLILASVKIVSSVLCITLTFLFMFVSSSFLLLGHMTRHTQSTPLIIQMH